jgi:hypothetical protein
LRTTAALLPVLWVLTGALQVPPSGQVAVTLDEIVARVDNDAIQSLDIRQARLLKLFGADVVADKEILDRLITRRLELADAARYPVPEPTPADIAARRGRWEATLGLSAPSALAALLQDAGATEAGLTAWFRDEARLEALENQRFASAPATRDQVAAYVREHPEAFVEPGGRPPDVDDPATQARARAAIAAATRAAAVANWAQTLRARAQITIR